MLIHMNSRAQQGKRQGKKERFLCADNQQRKLDALAEHRQSWVLELAPAGFSELLSCLLLARLTQAVES